MIFCNDLLSPLCAIHFRFLYVYFFTSVKSVIQVVKLHAYTPKQKHFSRLEVSCCVCAFVACHWWKLLVKDIAVQPNTSHWVLVKHTSFPRHTCSHHPRAQMGIGTSMKYINYIVQRNKINIKCACKATYTQMCTQLD